MRPPWLIVSGDFVKAGGMNQPNYEFARYLADKGFETHLVAYRVDEDLARHPSVVFHRVIKPADSYFLAQPLMKVIGQRWSRAVAARGGRVIINGTVCEWDDVNWVHHVQAVFSPQVAMGVTRRVKNRVQRRIDIAAERRILPRARVAITNSERTRREIIERLGSPAVGVRTVYLGIDSSLFRPPNADERAASRARLGVRQERPLVAFVGALGDSRKGFDTLFRAWAGLCAQANWDADLIVVGAGGELGVWKQRAAEARIGARLKFLGFDHAETFIAQTLWGCDALVLPSRYEGYGRPVQEALCCGVPALVTTASGIAEQYPADLGELLIPDPDDSEDLSARLRRWRSTGDTWRERVQSFGAALRQHTWRRMAEQMADLIERTPRKAPSAGGADRPAA